MGIMKKVNLDSIAADLGMTREEIEHCIALAENVSREDFDAYFSEDRYGKKSQEGLLEFAKVRKRKSRMTRASKNIELCSAAIAILNDEKPMTLRQLFYRLVSAGVIEPKQTEYHRVGRVMTRLRESGHVPRTWLVDHTRSTLKPSSWTGLAEFAETVRDAYRKDFWASLPHHVEIFVEKDAMAGTIQPVTEEYDIRLRVCRGYSSISFAGEISDLWSQIKKPIFAYYLGDYDPSGMDLERDLREKIERYTGRALWDFGEERPCTEVSGGILWCRIAVLASDFEQFDLITLAPKETDRRIKRFLQEHAGQCAEVDALPPSEVRRRVKEVIERHIDQERWRKLQQTESLEQKAILQIADHLQKTNLDSLSEATA
jgi:hypothetical protein